MKATGTTQKMDKSGRLVVPKDIQKQLGYTEGMKFELFISEDDCSLVFLLCTLVMLCLLLLL